MVSVPNELYARIRTKIPERQRSKFIVKLIEKELKRQDDELYKIALAIEKDAILSEEMKDWDVTAGDGIDNNETW